jgi:hypothetical protein
MSKEQIKNIIDNNSHEAAAVGRRTGARVPQKTARKRLL